jgi:hypothetical protein
MPSTITHPTSLELAILSKITTKQRTIAKTLNKINDIYTNHIRNASNIQNSDDRNAILNMLFILQPKNNNHFTLADMNMRAYIKSQTNV